MAITRKPKLVASTESPVDIDALINKGGSVARQAKAINSSDDVGRVILRVPGDVLARIDQAVEARKVRVPRHTWLLEALIEKLERETKMPV